MDAVSEDGGLYGTVPRAKGGGECIATRFKELGRLRDSLGVIREGGSGDLKVVRAGPITRGETTPRACSDARVGGKRAGSACLWNRTGVYGGRGGDRMRRCFRTGVEVRISMSGTEGAGVLGRRGVPSIGPPMRTGVRGAPSTGSSACTGIGGWGWGVIGQLRWFLVQHFQ